MATSKERGIRLSIHHVAGNDDLRPAMMNIYFKDGYMYATDAHVAVRAELKKVTTFSDEEIALIDGKFMHKSKFAKLCRAQVVQVTEDGILDVFDGILYKFTTFNGGYVSLEKILSERIASEPVEVSAIGLNPTFLNRLQKAMIPHGTYMGDGLKFSFAGPNKGVLVTPLSADIEGVVGLIMPVNL